MRTSILVLASTAVLLSACTTRRAELRADRQAVRQERAECQGAKAYGDRRDVRDECRDFRDARRELREDQRAPR